MFEGLTKLKTLKLSVNGAKLNKNYFKGLENLELLEIEDAELEEDFDSLDKLKKLKLEKVQLNKFTLKKLEKIEQLALISIKFTQEESLSNYQQMFFQNLKELKYLETFKFEHPRTHLLEDDKFLSGQIIQNILQISRH